MKKKDTAQALEKAIKMLEGMDIPFRAKVVFLALVGLSEGTNECCPSIREISRLASVSLSTVRRSIADLVALGLIQKKQRFHTDDGNLTNQYFLLGGMQREKP